MAGETCFSPAGPRICPWLGVHSRLGKRQARHMSPSINIILWDTTLGDLCTRSIGMPSPLMLNSYLPPKSNYCMHVFPCAEVRHSALRKQVVVYRWRRKHKLELKLNRSRCANWKIDKHQIITTLNSIPYLKATIKHLGSCLLFLMWRKPIKTYKEHEKNQGKMQSK